MKPIESKERVWHAIVHNDRLTQYEEYIRYAREEGYVLLPLEEFFLLPDAEKRACRHLILRHDVDHEGASTRRAPGHHPAQGVRVDRHPRGKPVQHRADGRAVALAEERHGDARSECVLHSFTAVSPSS